MAKNPINTAGWIVVCLNNLQPSVELLKHPEAKQLRDEYRADHYEARIVRVVRVVAPVKP